MARCTGVCLRHHTPSLIEQCAGKVASLAHYRAESDPLQRLRPLGDNADKVRPENFEFNAIHLDILPQSLEATMQPTASIVAIHPGAIAVVVSRSSMIAGP